MRSMKLSTEILITLSSPRPLTRDEDVVETNMDIFMDSFSFEVRMEEDTQLMGHTKKTPPKQLLWNSVAY